MANPLIHYIAEGSNFDGLAQNAARTSGGLFTWDAQGLPSGVWIAVRKISWDIEGTTPVLTSGTWDVVDRTVGTLLWDTQTVGPGAETTITGGTSGTVGTVEDITDDGTTGAILLSGITSGDDYTDGEAITGDVAFDGDANGTLTFLRERVDSASSLQYTQTFNPNELIVGPQASGTALQALRLTTTGMSTSFGTAKVYYEYYYPKQ